MRPCEGPTPEGAANAATKDNAPVAQLDRVLGYEPSGREFESLRARQKQKSPSLRGAFLFSLAEEDLDHYLRKNLMSDIFRLLMPRRSAIVNANLV